MKREDMNDSTKATSEEIEDNLDLESDTMKIDHKIKQDDKKGYFRKTIIIGFLLISCVSLVYAGVKTLEKRNLNNDQGEIIGSLENENTDENNLLDEDINKDPLLQYFDEMRVLKEWENKSFVVIDTKVGYPFGIMIHPLSDQFNDYGQIILDDNLLILPEVLDGYKFSNLSIYNHPHLPDANTIEAMIEGAGEERFITKEIETDEKRTMSYYYKSIDGDLTMEIRLDLNNESNFMGILKDLEVIKIDNVDVFVTKSNDMGTINRYNKSLILKGINHFKTTWYDTDRKIKISVNPGLKNSDHDVEEEVNGEYILTTTYPENTKEVLISFTELLHEALKSIE